MSCSTNGSTCHSSSGARSSARTGEVWITFPMTTATIAIHSTQVSVRRIRNLVQSDSLRWVSRSNPPNTACVQNRWYAAECSLIRKWIWRRASRPASTNTHAPDLSSVRIASDRPISGLLAIADQTRIHQISPRRIRNFSRSQRDSGFLVPRSSSRGCSPGAGSPSGGVVRASRTRGS